jgi:CRISPR-associated protein Cas2
MWVLVMFDLPVTLKAERRAATEFRNNLLDLGFQMSQFSVYMRFCTSTAQVSTFCRKVELSLPKGGNVNILQFTDKQYEKIISYTGKRKLASKKSPEQYELF